MDRVANDTDDVVSLGADVGGKDAYLATNDSVLLIRSLLRQQCKGPYGHTVKEVAFVLRIDGSVQAWGKSGPDNAAFQRRNSVVTIDIFVPVSEWSGRETAHIRSVIASGVAAAVERIGEHARRRKVDIDIEALRRDVSDALKKAAA